MSVIRSIIKLSQALLLQLSLLLICLMALGSVAVTLASAVGYLPWVQFDLRFGDTMVENAGLYVQIGITALSVMLLFYLPAHSRMLALESAHRKFGMQMEDVVRAYQTAHAADRAGQFTMASEFDAIKDRMEFLRDHPDLRDLEPEVLEVAAQMSQVSHELAETYSDAKVERARTFLTQRQQEVETFKSRLEDAKIVLHELRQWTRDVDIEESMARSQVQRLRAEFFDLLPELSAQQPGDDGGDSVVPISKPKPRGTE
ncbi:DNA repair protein [Rhodobacteraceae bacterium M382]|nr:DNA repair protein [Rhodobacteraceae bacterium M382]